MTRASSTCGARATRSPAAATTVRGFPAGPGYDMVTGLGTIDAARFVPDLVRLARGGAA